jgi:23S rRNA pseudouridine2457 synthase
MLQYILFHKPFQVLSQFSPEGEKLTLAHFFSGLSKDVYPVGRLDYDSEGLLLLTNDKSLNHKMLIPEHNHPRTYWAQVEGEITPKAIAQLEKGVSFSASGKTYKSKPATAFAFGEPPAVAPRNPPIRTRAAIPTSWVSLTLTEGKNRQVRKMTAAVGFPTLRLIRYAIGEYTLVGLQPGEWKKLDGFEIG